MLYTLIKTVHVLGGMVLLGTGAGIAFFMLMAHRSRNVALIAHTARIVVLADLVFTASAVVVQPLTGAWLAIEVGYGLSTPWIAAAIGLYVVAGLAWLPVIVIQIRMRDIAAEACRQEKALPATYHRLFRRWVLLGIPGFLATAAIVVLMVAKPDLPRWP